MLSPPRCTFPAPLEPRAYEKFRSWQQILKMADSYCAAQVNQKEMGYANHKSMEIINRNAPRPSFIMCGVKGMLSQIYQNYNCHSLENMLHIALINLRE
jgi:hypothetical protein